jgi:NTP pyrophosphatase (non-canonical NTP hydrolase)
VENCAQQSEDDCQSDGEAMKRLGAKPGAHPDRMLVTPESIEEAKKLVNVFTDTQLRLKGWGTFASRHEVLGSITEEYFELIDAIHHNDVYACEKELADIAVAAIFGIACIKQKSLDW